MPDFYEFFAGGGMARVGLGSGWRCRFANDIDPRKAAAYRANFGGDDLWLGDVRAVETAQLPGAADLVWGSFPCQDLSLAGAGAGLAGARSGTFYPFWDLVKGLAAEGRAPTLVAVENVCGALTSRGGRDFAAICRTFVDAGYAPGALVINADQFVPQSRPRLFVVGVHEGTPVDPALMSEGPVLPFHTTRLQRAVEALSPDLEAAHLWWRLPTPSARSLRFEDLIEDWPDGVAWHEPEETRRLLLLMAPLHREKVEAAKRTGRRMVGGVYRRTRPEPDGTRRQRAEVRFDEVSGCLRTPTGGSSRQVLLIVEGERVRSRLISARETARLMGLPDSYRLPAGYNDAYHLTGDGVAVDVVRHLARHLFEPILQSGSGRRAVA